MQIDEIFKDKVFITDLNTEQEICSDGEKATLGRYGVWAPSVAGDRHIIVEVGSDLEYLKKKYKIGADSVCVLKEIQK